MDTIVEGRGLNRRMRWCVALAFAFHLFYARAWLLDPPRRASSNGLAEMRAAGHWLDPHHPMLMWGLLYGAVAVLAALALLRRSEPLTVAMFALGVGVTAFYATCSAQTARADDSAPWTGAGTFTCIAVAHIFGVVANHRPRR